MPQLDVHSVVDELALLSFDNELIIGRLTALSGELDHQLVL